MRWYSWILTPLLTAVFGLFAAGSVAALLVDWYNVSSFEGASGFFVVFIALFGGFAGVVIGLIAAFVVSRRPNPGLLKAVGAGVGSSLVIALGVAGVARFLADIPPRLGGDLLFLQVELRWPAGSPRPVHEPGAATRLHSAVLSMVRKTADGPLWLEDARDEDGRWVVPGAVEIFTQRGQRLLDLGIGSRQLAGFVVPLPGHPRTEHEQWSEWLPNDRAGTEPEGGGFTYRFRVVRQSQPIRTMDIGPFQIGVLVSSFYRMSGSEDVSAWSVFEVAHREQAVPGAERAEYVGEVGGLTPALFIRNRREDGYDYCRFLVSMGESVESIDLGQCLQADEIAPLTSDVAAFARSRSRRPLRGWPDRLSFQVPGLYLVGDLVVDTRSRTAHRFTSPTDPYPVSGVPPLALSPDERTFVLLARDHEDKYFLVACEWNDARSYALPIDAGRMRFRSEKVLDPAWVAHHFEWVRQTDGVGLLRERAQFEVLPYAGEFSDEPTAPSYTIGPGKDALRDAVVTILTSELRAEPLPDGNYSFTKRVRLDGRVIEITVIETGPYVYVSYEGGTGDVAFLRSVAARMDAAFATRKWDGAFETN